MEDLRDERGSGVEPSGNGGGWRLKLRGTGPGLLSCARKSGRGIRTVLRSGGVWDKLFFDSLYGKAGGRLSESFHGSILWLQRISLF